MLSLLLALAFPAPPASAGPGPSLERLWSQSAAVFDGAARPRPASFESPVARAGEEPLALSEFAAALAADPRSLEAFIDALSKSLEGRSSWPGPAALDPADKKRLIEAIRRADSRALDSLPVMTVPQLKAFITAYGRLKGPLQDPGEPSGVEALALPGGPDLPAPGAYLKEISPGVRYGDRSARSLPAKFGDSRRLAELLNKLALNDPAAPTFFVERGGERFSSPRDLLARLLADGHALSVADMRFFANFGDLWVEAGGKLRGVMTPLYVDSGVRLPSGRPLVMPVTHSELQIRVSGPEVNALVNFYLGVDGSSQFNAEGTEGQPWVGGREAARWDGAAALDLVDRAATARRELRLKTLRHGLPLGGYGALGGCNDVTAMLVGRPIWPMIRDPRYYRDGMTIDAWSDALPVDGAAPADPRRVYESLPAEPDALLVPSARDAARELRDSLR